MIIYNFNDIDLINLLVDKIDTNILILYKNKKLLNYLKSFLDNSGKIIYKKSAKNILKYKFIIVWNKKLLNIQDNSTKKIIFYFNTPNINYKFFELSNLDGEINEINRYLSNSIENKSSVIDTNNPLENEFTNIDEIQQLQKDNNHKFIDENKVIKINEKDDKDFYTFKILQYLEFNIDLFNKLILNYDKIAK